MLRILFRGLAFLIVAVTCKVKVIGKEKIPLRGGAIMASNHLGRLDVIFAYTAIPRADVIMTVAEKYQKIGFFRLAAKALNAFFIDRFNADLGALRKVMRRLQQGEILGIAPEGTRSDTGALIQGRPGTAYLAAKTQVPVLPTAFMGTEDHKVVASLKAIQRAPVTITIGDPVYLPPLPKEGRDTALQTYTDEIMCQIAALLPPEYRGVYAGHPRLNELLASHNPISHPALDSK